MPDDVRAEAGYDQDFCRWSQEQATLLRARARSDASGLDWDNLAEEIESLGKSQRQEVRRRLDTIYEHLLKLKHSPSPHPREGWRNTIRRSRREIRELLKDSPSLRQLVSEWQDADLDAVAAISAGSLRERGELDAAGAVLVAWQQETEIVARVLDEDFFPHPADPS